MTSPVAPRSGRLIVLDGAEGAGKTTQLARIVARLAAAGVPHLAVREPGGTPVGDEVRRLLLHAGHDITPRAEALLFMASRAELVDRVIHPALAAGKVVLADRFFLSTYAYQIAARGLSDGEVRSANAFATAGLIPDLTLLLEFPVGDGLARAEGRSELGADRIESTGHDFHRLVAQAFERFARPEWQAAHPECGPIVTVDARGSAEQVETRLLSVLATRWPETFQFVVESHR
jgi:dTMP kinase